MIEMLEIFHLNILQLCSFTRNVEHYAVTRKVSTVVIIVISFPFSCSFVVDEFHSLDTLNIDVPKEP